MPRRFIVKKKNIHFDLKHNRHELLQLESQFEKVYSAFDSNNFRKFYEKIYNKKIYISNVDSDSFTKNVQIRGHKLDKRDLLEACDLIIELYYKVSSYDLVGEIKFDIVGFNRFKDLLEMMNEGIIKNNEITFFREFFILEIHNYLINYYCKIRRYHSHLQDSFWLQLHLEIVDYPKIVKSFIDEDFRYCADLSLAVLKDRVKDILSYSNRKNHYKSESDMMMQVFNEKNPQIKINLLSNPTEINEQKGFKFIMSGLFAKYRNKYSHNQLENIDIYECINILFIVTECLDVLDKIKN